MTLLGKIFTVLIMVMSVVFMSFTIVVFATHTNWRDKADDLGKKLQQQEEANRQLREREQRLQDNLAMEQAARKFALASLQTKYTQQGEQLALREREKTQLTDAMNEALADVTAAQTLMQQLTQEVTTLRTDLRGAHQDMDQKFQIAVRLSDEVNEARRVRQQLEERQAPLLRQVAGYSDILRKLGIRWEVVPDGTVVSDVNQLPPNVEGLVVAVNERNLIEISIGSDDGLKVGHKLDVFRDRAYLGRVIIRETNPDKAVAEIIPDYRKGVIKKGDHVSTRLS